jgi:excisionase family DNA binding protein
MQHSEAAPANIELSAKEQREILDIYAKLRDAHAKLVGPDGVTQTLPPNLYAFLLRLLADLKAGHSVTILQRNAMLTTVEASKVLGVSRQFLVQLLEKGELPYHMVGTHRRMYARDVLTYKLKRNTARHKILDDVAREEFEQGTYDSIPDDFNQGQ